MTGSINPHAGRFRSAAAWLMSDARSPDLDGEARGLLRFLDYENSDGVTAGPRARLLRAAATFRRLFQLPVPDAPGLVFCGAEADPACLGAQFSGLSAGSLAGSGPTAQRAFESCVGEGVEYLSQFAQGTAQGTDRIEIGSVNEQLGALDDVTGRFIKVILGACAIDPARPIGWVRVQRLPAGTEAWLPADLCLRRAPARQDFTPPLKLSSGCSAGVTEDDAALRAALELIERDAAALWWRGGRRGRAIPANSEAGQAAATLLEHLRQGTTGRRSWLLDITTDLGIPAIAALSAREDGFGFSFGLAARVRPAEAARAAIFELCQSELAHHVVAAKQRESGDRLLNENDQRRLRHGSEIDTRHCALLQPLGESVLASGDAGGDAAIGLRTVQDRLAVAGVAAYRMTLTRPQFEVPVVRVVAPGLQAEPCAIVGERLARAMAETGGGAVHTGGVSLL
jgi:ribosomal protein S12 methylthiotransferase accessory factor